MTTDPPRHDRVREEPRAHRERSSRCRPGRRDEPRPDADRLPERGAARSSTACRRAARRKERARTTGARPGRDRGWRGGAPRFRPKAGRARRRVSSPRPRGETEHGPRRRHEPAAPCVLGCRSSPLRRPGSWPNRCSSPRHQNTNTCSCQGSGDVCGDKTGVVRAPYGQRPPYRREQGSSLGLKGNCTYTPPYR